MKKFLIALGVLAALSGSAAAVGSAAGWFEFRSATATSNPCRTGKACVYPNATDGKIHLVDQSGNDTIPGTVGISYAPFSWQTWFQHNTNTIAQGGNTTVGKLFAVGTNSTATGAKGYWAGPATSIKVSLWSSGGVRLASGTAAVGSASTYSINFSATQPLVAGTQYVVTVWDTSGTNYTTVLSAIGPAGNSVNGFLANPGPVSLTYYDNLYGTGDIFPGSTISTQIYGVDPVYTTP